MSAYRTVRPLAQGGMGTVDLVVRSEGAFRRAYARKRLKAAYREEPEMRAMFMAEARIAGLLHHPNAVSVVDVGEDGDGPFLVMEYVPGVSLAALVHALNERGETLPQQAALRIFIEVMRGLHAAHELRGHDGALLGLVHRDVSPQNILIGFDGVARLTDFGIAKAKVSHDRTATGILKGKVGYLAPEQLRFRGVSRQSDLFSVGVVLFEALTGRRLYRRDDVEATARAILEEPPPDIFDLRPDLHPALIELLIRLLAKNPDRRPETALEVVHRLEAVLVEVLLEEPPCEVSLLLSERFDETRRAVEDELESATRIEPSGGRRAPRRGAVIAVVIALAAAAGVVAVVLGAGPSAEGPDETAPSEVSTVAVPPPETVDDATRADVDDEPSVIDEAIDAVPDAEAAADDTVAESAALRPTRRRSRRHHRARTEASPPPSGPTPTPERPRRSAPDDRPGTGAWDWNGSAR